MTSEVVKYAPKAVIDELDNFNIKYTNISSFVSSIYHFKSESALISWTLETDVQDHKEPRLLAALNHVFGNERLQPERESRWYVQGIDFVVALDDEDGRLDSWFYPVHIPEDRLMTEKQARGYAELFGGEPKEIK